MQKDSMACQICVYRTHVSYYYIYCVDFFFPVSGTTAYVINRNMPDLTAVTVCLWMQSADNDNKGTPFSYAIKKQQNELHAAFQLQELRYIGGR